MQNVVGRDVTGCQAESPDHLHFQANFQFPPTIFLRSHWSWKLRTAHLRGEGGGGRRKGGLYLTALIMESVNICFVRIPVLDALIVLIDFGKLCHLNILDVMYQSWGAWSFWKGWLYFPKGQKEKKGAMGSVWRQLEWKDGCTVENTHAPLLYATQTLPAFLVFSQSDTINRKTCWSHF